MKPGQCGIDGDFCVEQRGPTNNPGTAPVGVNGCVSNCGTDIQNGQEGPASFGKIGYYESWNFHRPCLNMRSSSLATEAPDLTHVHWGFVNVEADMSITIPDDHGQWQGFLSLPSSMKKIISFGGWAFSTEPETYQLLREAVSVSNRFRFAANVLNFIHGSYSRPVVIPASDGPELAFPCTSGRLLLIIRQNITWMASISTGSILV